MFEAVPATFGISWWKTFRCGMGTALVSWTHRECSLPEQKSSGPRSVLTQREADRFLSRTVDVQYCQSRRRKLSMSTSLLPLLSNQTPPSSSPSPELVS